MIRLALLYWVHLSVFLGVSVIAAQIGGWIFVLAWTVLYIGFLAKHSLGIDWHGDPIQRN